MKALVVEDDFGSRRLMQAILRDYFEVDAVVDGVEAIEAFRLAWHKNDPYIVILLDIMLPRKDGQETLKEIRTLEKEMGVSQLDETKIIMTTALDDPKNVVESFNKGGATGYLVKPIDREILLAQLTKCGIRVQA